MMEWSQEALGSPDKHDHERTNLWIVCRLFSNCFVLLLRKEHEGRLEALGSIRRLFKFGKITLSLGHGGCLLIGEGMVLVAYQNSSRWRLFYVAAAATRCFFTYFPCPILEIKTICSRFTDIWNCLGNLSRQMNEWQRVWKFFTSEFRHTIW